MKAIWMMLLLVCSLATAQGERPAWQDIELTDARTGETFTLGGLEGKTVYVEPMATWCVNCRRQLQNVRAAQEDLPEDVVVVALSVEGNLPNETLAAYAEKEGFDFVFAVAPVDLLQRLVETFGRAITSPPSTPHFVLYPDGSHSELATGSKSPEAILQFVAER